MMSAKLAVFAGALLHSSAGEMSWPLQVYWSGIIAPEANAGLVSVNSWHGPPWTKRIALAPWF